MLFNTKLCFVNSPNQFNFFIRQFLAIFPNCYSSTSKNQSIKSSNADNEVEQQMEIGPSFLTTNIGSNYLKWSTILNKHPELKCLKSKDIINTINFLRKINFSLNDILEKPTILHTNELTLEHRYNILVECGFQNINVSLLSKYVGAMNKTVNTLKLLHHIPYSLNVVERLKETFTDIEIELGTKYDCDENIGLKILRKNTLNYYLEQRLDMSAKEIEKLWKVYGRLQNKSYRSIQEMVKLLLNDLDFPKDRIIKNGFTLYADADNVRRIIKEIPTIADQDIKEILHKRPKIMMSSCDALLANISHIKSFGIDECAILKCIEVLTLGPDTVLERLKYLNEIEEFQVLSSNPRILRLVHYQNKARLRLEYLNQLKVRCASLHILSCGSRAFAKFARDGSDCTRGRDIIVYLSHTLNKSKQDLRNLLSRNPNWCHIPVLQVKQSYEFLLSNEFTNNDIYSNIHLLLYTKEQINEKLQLLLKPEHFDELRISKRFYDLTKNEVLILVLYLIEKEFHFTGDGIWTQHTTQHVENFHNLLPDFPEGLNKDYKYGTKPAGSTS